MYSSPCKRSSKRFLLFKLSHTEYNMKKLSFSTKLPSGKLSVAQTPTFLDLLHVTEAVKRILIYFIYKRKMILYNFYLH